MNISQPHIHFLEYNPNGSRSVLLLHGLGANGSSWQLQVPDFVSANYRVIAPDMPGFGNSRYHGGKTTISAIAEDMLGLLNSLHIKNTDVVGISMGGTVALQMGLDHPAIVRKLVLVNTFARLRPDNLSGWFYFAQRLALVQLLGIPAQAKVVSMRLFPKPEQEELRRLLVEQLTEADPKGYRASMLALWSFNVLKRLGSLNLPTMVITGDSDTTVPFKAQKVLAEGIPAASHVIIPGAGHAVSVEKPLEFNQVLMQFLE